MNWHRAITHVVAEAKICVPVGLVGDLCGLGEEVGPVLLNLLVELRRQLRVPRICKR